jgi:hypothetical protein
MGQITAQRGTFYSTSRADGGPIGIYRMNQAGRRASKSFFPFVLPAQ